ncbi:ADP-ribosylation factor family domain-containingprotein [Encephalitozoon cuniculi EcunIII-L]|uniref:Uncharacterized protein n=1 Tax=Encephalitozoon cuniculi TaxID=6035 RepID=M1K3M2_ENCCN|nr:hypothetical protein ECU05_1000 [Encephalitozoon cuniculi]KMV66157.1 ADP-ribosylation factor family domain-containingprotein [Encephalitozoon cuniculi EcunIII-L]UYI27894.1 ADP-ribosylation factor [Encephalitozoon cuniculi]
MLEVCKKLRKKLVDICNSIFVVRLRVVVLGLGRSGKSTIVMKAFRDGLRYVGRQRGSRVYEYNEGCMSCVVYDVPGRRVSKARWDYFYGKCDVLLYCVDSSESPGKWTGAREELKSLLYRNAWTKRSMLVLGTKNERKDALGCIDIILRLGLLDITDREVSCFSVSAREDVNMECIRAWIREQCDLLREKNCLGVGTREWTVDLNSCL